MNPADQILSQLNAQSAAALINLANNVRALLMLGTTEIDPSDWRYRDHLTAAARVSDVLDMGANVLKKKFKNELGGLTAPREPRSLPAPEEATRIRFSKLDLDPPEKQKPIFGVEEKLRRELYNVLGLEPPAKPSVANENERDGRRAYEAKPGVAQKAPSKPCASQHAYVYTTLSPTENDPCSKCGYRRGTLRRWEDRKYARSQ